MLAQEIKDAYASGRAHKVDSMYEWTTDESNEFRECCIFVEYKEGNFYSIHNDGSVYRAEARRFFVDTDRLE